MLYLVVVVLGCSVVVPSVASVPRPRSWDWNAVPSALRDGSAALQGITIEDDILTLNHLPRHGVRSVALDEDLLWPNGVVPYELASGEWQPTERAKLRAALDDLMKETCVRFKERDQEADYLVLRNVGDHCASVVGYRRGLGGLPLFLGGPGCHRKGTVQHEMLHSLGFWHEHTRPDRDRFVEVKWDHIIPGREGNFFKRPIASAKSMSLPYDYGSVMHYRAKAFSKDGKKTLVPVRKEFTSVLGQRKRFSSWDIAKLNVLYDCPAQYYRGPKVLAPVKKPTQNKHNVTETNSVPKV